MIYATCPEKVICYVGCTDMKFFAAFVRMWNMWIVDDLVLNYRNCLLHLRLGYLDCNFFFFFFSRVKSVPSEEGTATLI